MDGNGVSLSAAFLAGLVSFVSPCVLPLMPVYAAMLTGAGGEAQPGRWSAVINTAAFMAGFTLVFIAMGATASLLGQLFFDHQDFLRKAGALFIIFMGSHLAGFVRLPAMHREWRPLGAGKLHGPAGALLLGIAVTTGWTPCIGPILSAVLTYAGMGGTISTGIYLLLAYAAGFALPFLVFAVLFRRWFSPDASWYRWLPAVQKAAGVIMMFVGILIFFNLVPRILGLIVI